MYRRVICLQALTKIVKKLREWLSNTKIRNSNNANQTGRGPQKHTVACRDSVLILSDYGVMRTYESTCALYVCVCVCFGNTDDDPTEGLRRMVT